MPVPPAVPEADSSQAEFPEAVRKALAVVDALDRNRRLFILVDALACAGNSSTTDALLTGMLVELSAAGKLMTYYNRVETQRRELAAMGAGYLGTQFWCNMPPALRFELCRRAVKDPEIVDILRDLGPGNPRVRGNEDWLALAQGAAIYANDEPLFVQLYRLKPALAQRRIQLRLTAPTAAWLESRRGVVRRVVCDDAVKSFLFDGALSPALGWTSQRQLEGGDPAIEAFHPVSKAGLHLWSGRWQEAEAELEALEEADAYWQTHYLRGMALLLHGKAESLACIKRCFELHGEAHPEPFSSLPSVPRFARQLAIFLFGSSSEQEQLVREAPYASDKIYRLEQRWNGVRGLRALQALASLRQGEAGKGRFLLYRNQGQEPNFLAAMVYFGALQRLGLLRQDEWRGAVEALEAWHAGLAGVPAAQGIAGGILAKALAPERAAAFAPDPVCRNMLDFSLLVEEKSFWQVRLGALEQVARNEEAPREDQTEEKRLFWAVDKDMRLVEAREQTRTARGWGAPRVAAIKRLRDRQDEYGWLTPADRRILACAESRDHWGNSPLILRLENCCEALEGLGNVCRMTNAGLEPVHVRRGALKLKLTSHGDACRLAIDGFDLSKADLEGGDRTFLYQDGTIYYFMLSMRERRIAAIVGAGIDFPKSAIQRVLDLSLQDAGVPLKAEIEAEEIEADPTPVLQLEQDGVGGFFALVGVRPFGLPGTPFYPTGEGASNPLAAVARPAPAAPAAPEEPGASGEAEAVSAAPARAGESGEAEAAPAAPAESAESGETGETAEIGKSVEAEAAPVAPAESGETAEDGKSGEAETAPVAPAESGETGETVEAETSSAAPAAAGGPGVPAPSGAAETVPMRARRDFEAEKAALAALAAACPCLDNGLDGQSWHSQKPDEVLELLEELRRAEQPSRVEWPRGHAVRLAGTLKPASVKLSVSRGPGRDWFSLSGEASIDEGRVVTVEALLQSLEGSRFVSLGEGEYLALTDELRRKLSGLKAMMEGKARGGEMQFSGLAAPAVEQIAQGMDIQADAAFDASLERMHKAFAETPAKPDGLMADLRDYQREGYEWLQRLAIWGVGACLADDMGLGKTVQTIAVMLNQAPKGPCLVVAPTTVCANWEREIARFAPRLETKRLGMAGRDEAVKAMARGEVLVVGYGLLPNVAAELASIQWAMAVFDEAQALKNPLTKRAAAARGVKADFRLALTGTPIENRLDDLWSIFAIINPGLLGSFERFKRRFGQASPGSPQGKALRQLTRPFLLRRLKSAVLDELPERTEQNIVIDPTDDEKAFYEIMRRKAVESIEQAEPKQRRFLILAWLTRMRLACCSPSLASEDIKAGARRGGLKFGSKIDRLRETLEELIAGGHKALVFSQFTSFLALVQQALKKAGIAFLYLDGQTPEKERRRLVDDFQNGACSVFLLSLKAGGTGINLTAADYVVHLDPWWNPAAEDQASDRAHRIGQLRPVTIYRFIMGGTVEEKILAMHREKRDLAAGFLEGTEQAVKRITDEELLELLR